MDDNEARRKRLVTIGKYAVGVGVLAVVAPIAAAALSATAALVTTALLGGAAITFAPVVSMRFANWKMRAIVAEAEANPIETMQNLEVEKAQELATADQNISDFETEVRNFADQVDGFKKEYPAEAQSYETLLGKMNEALADMKSQQSSARKELVNFEGQIKKAKAIYKMALAAQKVVKLSKSAEAQVFAKIKEQVAFDSVRGQLNRSFSNLNLALERRADARALPVPAISTPKELSA